MSTIDDQNLLSTIARYRAEEAIMTDRHDDLSWREIDAWHDSVPMLTAMGALAALRTDLGPFLLPCGIAGGTKAAALEKRKARRAPGLPPTFPRQSVLREKSPVSANGQRGQTEAAHISRGRLPSGCGKKSHPRGVEHDGLGH